MKREGEASIAASREARAERIAAARKQWVERRSTGCVSAYSTRAADACVECPADRPRPSAWRLPALSWTRAAARLPEPNA